MVTLPFALIIDETTENIKEKVTSDEILVTLVDVLKPWSKHKEDVNVEGKGAGGGVAAGQAGLLVLLV